MNLPALTIHLGDAEVVLIPVVHYHPGSAWAVVHVLDSFQPRVVAIELPQGLDQAVVQALPDEKAVANALVYRTGDCRGVDRQVIILSIADAFTQAALWARARHVSVACIDLPCFHDSPGNVEQDFPDPWAARKLGRAYMEIAVGSVCSDTSKSDENRNNQMAANLQRLASEHRRVVAIVGAAHALPIQALLNADKPIKMKSTSISADVVRADVDAQLLLRHYLGPIPALALELDKSCRAGTVGKLNPRSAVEKIVENAAADYERDFQPLDITQRIHFWNAIWCWVTHRRRTIPSLVELYQAARASVNDNDEFARYLAFHAIGLRLKPRRDLTRPVVVEGDDKAMFIDIDGKRIPIRPPHGKALKVRIPLPIDDLDQWWEIRRRPRPMDPLATDFGMLSDTNTWDGQINFWDHAMALVKDHELASVRWQGGALRQMDFRATVRARAQGQHSLYVRRRISRTVKSDTADADPLVVFFDEDFQPTNIEAFCLGVYSHRSQYYHTSANLASEIRYTDGTTVYRLAARAAFVSPHLVNFDIALRHKDQSAARRWFSRWLARDNNEAHIPKCDIFSDASLLGRVPSALQATAQQCPPWEWMTMAAILYARTRVVHVAQRPPADWLRRLARHRRVRLLTLPLSYFPAHERVAASTYVLRLTPRSW